MWYAGAIPLLLLVWCGILTLYGHAQALSSWSVSVTVVLLLPCVFMVALLFALRV